MPYDSRAVANYILDRGRELGLRLTPMHVLKLVYIAHGWHLAIHDKPLISQKIEAWDYGPVVPELYHAIKRYGRDEITAPITRIKGSIEQILDTPVGEWETEKIEADFTEEERSLLNKVIEVYGGLRAFQLSSMTHREGTPWNEAKDRGLNLRGAAISNSAIRKHFISLARRNAE